eukprot:gene15976-biopygen21754
MCYTPCNRGPDVCQVYRMLPSPPLYPLATTRRPGCRPKSIQENINKTRVEHAPPRLNSRPPETGFAGHKGVGCRQHDAEGRYSLRAGGIRLSSCPCGTAVWATSRETSTLHRCKMYRHKIRGPTYFAVGMFRASIAALEFERLTTTRAKEIPFKGVRVSTPSKAVLLAEHHIPWHHIHIPPHRLPQSEKLFLCNRCQPLFGHSSWRSHPGPDASMGRGGGYGNRPPVATPQLASCTYHWCVSRSL